jgi:hypothetical protein
VVEVAKMLDEMVFAVEGAEFFGECLAFLVVVVCKMSW